MKTVGHLLFTSDTHAHWLPREAASHTLFETAGALKEMKQSFDEKNEPWIQIDLGDFIQGSSFATYLNEVKQDGTPLARAMNQMGYDYQVLGNHEFNYGMAYQAEILEQMDATLLNSNLLEASSNKPFAGKPYDIIKLNDLTMGLIGVTTHYIPNWELPENYQGITFLHAFEAVKLTVEEIRPLVDMVVVLYHGGLESDLETGMPLEVLTSENQGYQMLKDIPGIDILLTGHQHREICQKFENAWVLQPGFAGEKIGHIEVKINDKGDTHIEGNLIDCQDFKADEELKALMSEDIEACHQWLDEVIGEAVIHSDETIGFNVRKNGHPFIEMINYVQLKETGADFSAASLLNDYFVDFKGPITRRDLLKIYPYYNLVAKVEISGQELYEVMEYNYAYFSIGEKGDLTVNPDYLEPKPKHYNFDLYSGLLIKIDMNKDPGERIIELCDEHTSEPIERDKMYTLALTQYRAVGGGDYHWFNEDRILSLSDKDIAQLITDGLKTLTDEEWNTINQNCHRVEWINP